MTGGKRLIEIMAGGVALLDFDLDGRLDVFLTNGAAHPSLEKDSPVFWNRLYRNSGNGKFEDVTQKAGVAGLGYSIAAAVADYDNDGYPDMFVAGVNGNQLLRNRGDGTFEDGTRRAGLLPAGKPRWAVAGGWFDYDLDGHLDLFVVNYVVWDPALEPFCGDIATRKYRTYCHPREYAPLPNQLYRNNGDGTFTDVSRAAGLDAHPSKGMSLSFGDIDGDHRLDVFITNDVEPNSLFLNLAGGRFREIGAQAGVAYNDDGRALSSMGSDFRDVDNDGRDDIFFTALANETFPLFRNLGRNQAFADRTYASRIGRGTMAHSGWSTGIYDFDNDGWKDMFVAGGDVQTNTELFSSRQSKLPNMLIRNKGDGTFDCVTFGVPALHRGAAFGDIDNDGRIDVLVSRLNETPAIFLNTAPASAHWLGFKLRGTKSNRDGLGALIRVETPSGKVQWNRATTAVGYASSSSKDVHFGLGAESAVKSVEIRWPSGVVQKVDVSAVDRYLTVTEP